MKEPGRWQDCGARRRAAVHPITLTLAAIFWDNVQTLLAEPPRGTARGAGLTLRAPEPGAASGTQLWPETGWANPSCLLPPLRAPLCPF